jgi:translation initiation factor 1A
LPPKKKPKPTKQQKRRGPGRGRFGSPQEGAVRVRRPPEGIIFGIVLRMLGGNHIEAQCADGVKRMVRIPGKIRRRQWVRVGDVVAVEPWYGMDETKADLKARYKANEIRALERRGYLRGLEDLIAEA